MSRASLSVKLDVAVLSRAAELTNQALGTVVQDLADEIVEDAKANCPRSDIDKEGYLHLQDSLTSEVIGDLEIEVHDGVPHGVFVELGTNGAHPRPARPFLTPAVERGKQRLPVLVGEALAGLWQEAGGR